MVQTRRTLMSAELARDLRREKGDVFSVKIGNRRLNEGDTIAITGLRGEFVFHAARIVDGECVWLQVFGGQADRQAWRHVTPDRLQRKIRVPKIKPKGGAACQ